MQPDNPNRRCCGLADAYWADSYEVKDDQYIAIITDERDDEPLRRPHIENGRRFVVPNSKIKWDSGNRPGTALSLSAMALKSIVTCHPGEGSDFLTPCTAPLIANFGVHGNAPLPWTCRDVRFSNRPGWVKRFQTIHRCRCQTACTAIFTNCWKANYKAKKPIWWKSRQR